MWKHDEPPRTWAVAMVVSTPSASGKPLGASRGDDACLVVWRWAAWAFLHGRRHPPCVRKGAFLTAAKPVPTSSEQ